MRPERRQGAKPSPQPGGWCCDHRAPSGRCSGGHQGGAHRGFGGAAPWGSNFGCFSDSLEPRGEKAFRAELPSCPLLSCPKVFWAQVDPSRPTHGDEQGGPVSK